MSRKYVLLLVSLALLITVAGCTFFKGSDSAETEAGADSGDDDAAAVVESDDDSNGKYGYVTVETLIVRSKPGTSGDKLGKVFVGDKLTITGKSSSTDTIAGKTDYWYNFTKGSLSGWVFGGFISMKATYSKDVLMEKLKGSYSYSDKENGYPTRLLIIKDDTYTERWFDSYLGITDEFSGTIVYQAYDITLVPQTRKARPSVYIDIPRDGNEENVYSYAYRLYDESPGRLYQLNRLKVTDGAGKLIIKNIDSDIILVTPERDRVIQSDNITETSNMFPGYRKN